MSNDKLDQLAQEIKTEHKAAETGMRDSLLHARRAGELLLEVKAALEHGEFGRWIEAHCGFTWRTANLYMRVTREWEKLLEQNSQGITNLSLWSAAELLTVSDDGEYAADAATLVEWRVLVPHALDGLTAGEARTVVKELRAAYDYMVEDPERGKRVATSDELIYSTTKDGVPRLTAANPCPRVVFDPRALLVRGGEAIAALKAGEIGRAQFRQAFVALKKGDTVGFYQRAHIKIRQVVPTRGSGGGPSRGREVFQLPDATLAQYLEIAWRFCEQTEHITTGGLVGGYTEKERADISRACGEMRAALDALQKMLEQLERNLRVIDAEVVPVVDPEVVTAAP